ncbi:MAG: hypothetical protein ABW168_05110 [Sedimenticola sp.]
MTKKLDLAPLLRFMETLPKSGDVELTLLKCHLLVEEELTNIIYKSHKNPKYIKDARLSFSQKTKLARASNDISHSAWVWKGLELLNKTRNELAHNLTSHEIENKLEAFISHMKKSGPEWPKEAISGKFTNFHWAAFVAYNIISSAASFDPASVKPVTLLSKNA